MGIRDRMKAFAHGWNAFVNPKEDPEVSDYRGLGSGGGWGGASFGTRTKSYNDKSIVTSIYLRLAVDVSSVFQKHVRNDKNGNYLETIDSGLNQCLNVEANLDQAGSQFRLDMAWSLFNQGFIAIVPVESDQNPNETGSYDIRSMRVGEIKTWYPAFVRVSVYNEKSGQREELVLPKKLVAIVENPFYAVMNEPNSILQRIIRKLQLLDAVDEAAGSGKLDMIIQLPYTIKTETKREQAEARREQIETQLKSSKYGIAYTDGLEKITQLNRPVENNMLKQIEYLMGQLYGQLGLDESIMNGTASEETILNYRNRTLVPVLRAFTEAMARSFLTKTARTQGQSVDYQMDMFQLMTLSKLAEAADILLRNEVVTSNEIRGWLGLRPSEDPKADQLVNSNMPQPAEIEAAPEGEPPADAEADEQAALMEETFAALEKTADEIVSGAGG